MTDKQEMFCVEYLVDLNATQAAIRAGYSKKTAADIACQNLAKLDIQNKISDLKAQRTERVEVDADSIVKQLELLRSANINDYVEVITVDKEQKIKFKDFKDLTEDQLSCIESVKMGKYGVEMKLHGKEWTIEKLNRHIGFYEKDNDQSNKVIISAEDRAKRMSELEEKMKGEK